MTGVWVGVFGLVCMPCVCLGVMWGLARIKVTHCVLLVYQVHCVTVEALEYEHGGCGGGYSPPLALCWSLWNPSNLSFPLILKYHPLCLNPFIFPPLLCGLRPIAPCNDPSPRQCHRPHATVSPPGIDLRCPEERTRIAAESTECPWHHGRRSGEGNFLRRPTWQGMGGRSHQLRTRSGLGRRGTHTEYSNAHWY